MSISLYQRYKEQCDVNGVSKNNFRNRVRNGWSPEKAATTPVKRYAIKFLEV